MSPRRRLMFLIVGSLAVALVLTLVVTRLVRGRSLSVPAQDVPGAVLLIPGYGGNAGSLEALAGVIRASGRTASVVALPDGGTGDLRRQAEAVDQAASQLLRDAPSLDVIGYSAGGVVARLWVSQYDGLHKARRVVTLGSPHHGAQIAAAGGAVLPAACPVACQQLAPGSTLLASLPDSVSQPPVWVSIWSEQDETVTPPTSSQLDGAVDVDIQQNCPGRSVAHGELPSDDYVTTVVLDAIGADPVSVSTC